MNEGAIMEGLREKIIFAVGEYYHLYNRGVEKRKTFMRHADSARFIRLLYLANGTEPYKYERLKEKALTEIDRGKAIVAIGAYVLMQNHFHLLAREIVDGGISTFMEKLATGYSSYFNKRHERVGPLFQGRFKAQHIGRDEHLKYLYAYIHLNPVKLIDPKWKENKIFDRKKAEAYLNKYKYSSFLDYAGQQKREEAAILTKEAFPEYFTDHLEFSNFIKDWLANDEYSEFV